MSLQGKNVVIIGGTSGIGLATAVMAQAAVQTFGQLAEPRKRSRKLQPCIL